MHLVVKKFDELTTTELYEILKARAAVFVVEQNRTWMISTMTACTCFIRTEKLSRPISGHFINRRRLCRWDVC